MHPAIQSVFLLRDRDLVRWGRGTAILMFVLAAICFGAAGFVYQMNGSRLKPAVHRNLEGEIQQIRFLENKGYDFDAEKMIAGQRKAHQGILKVTGSLVWIFAGAGLLALSHGMVSWRAHELARLNEANAEQVAKGSRRIADTAKAQTEHGTHQST